eukprot:11204058-Lingulodinium_polyedra.AAC.1
MLMAGDNGPERPFRVNAQRGAYATQHKALRRRAVADKGLERRATVANVLESRASPPAAAER